MISWHCSVTARCNNSYLHGYNIYMHEKELLFKYDTGISTEDNL